jgi:hypothetical protein
MVAKATVEAASEQQLPGSREGAWKWEIRNKMWDYMEANDIARCCGAAAASAHRWHAPVAAIARPPPARHA